VVSCFFFFFFGVSVTGFLFSPLFFRNKTPFFFVRGRSLVSPPPFFSDHVVLWWNPFCFFFFFFVCFFWVLQLSERDGCLFAKSWSFFFVFVVGVFLSTVRTRVAASSQPLFLFFCFWVLNPVAHVFCFFFVCYVLFFLFLFVFFALVCFFFFTLLCLFPFPLSLSFFKVIQRPPPAHHPLLKLSPLLYSVHAPRSPDQDPRMTRPPFFLRASCDSWEGFDPLR